MTSSLLTLLLWSSVVAVPCEVQANQPAVTTTKDDDNSKKDETKKAGPVVIGGATKYEPYQLVRLRAQNVPQKAGVLWSIKPLDNQNPNSVSWSKSGRKVREPEWVAPPGRYQVELSVITLDTDGVPDLSVYEILVTIGVAPNPPNPPTPPQPGPPQPTPSTAPFPSPGLAVLIVYESGEATTLSAGQHNILYGTKVRDFLRTSTFKDQGNPNGAFRIYDKDIDLTSESTMWKAAMSVAPRTGPFPYVIISNGKTGYSGPIPAGMTPDEFIALVTKYTQ